MNKKELDKNFRDNAFLYSLSLIDKTDTELLKAFNNMYKKYNTLKLKYKKSELDFLFDGICNELCFRNLEFK